MRMLRDVMSTTIDELSNETFDNFRDLIYRETGIFMRDTKRILVSNRLRKRIVALKLKGYDDYYRFLTETRGGRVELRNFIDAISTNETYFYRGDNHFKALSTIILPELFEKRSSLKVWCAGCSTGEEAYTIGMVILETAGEKWRGGVEIIGTDINTEVIEKAKKGIYSGRTLRLMPEELINRYFECLGDGRYRIGERAQKVVRFQVHNLLKDEPPARGFDVIFCRNVMIYFDKPTQKRLVDGGFAEAITPKGYLFIGHSESLIGVSDHFKYARIMKAPIYRATRGKKEIET